jgi:hypothetical protein
MIQDKLNSPIFVSGIERSGSSIIAKIIRHCGSFTGMTTEKLLDTYYELLDCDIKGQHPIPDTKKLIIPTNWKQKVDDILADEKYDEFTPWMLKGSRLCQTWPIWHYAYPNAKWIIVRRRTGDIIESCLKTGYMTAYKNKEGWLDWVHEHEKLFVDMIETGVNCKIVWPERMATGDYGQIFEMLDWVGLPWDNNIVQMVEPLLYNSKQRRKGA